ncbi:RecT Recombinational DNA repair protein (RecE pathway) [uncultured Caudovirales phage]|uniref:RecT Recombinational DNA repair protein (RecE pathway) n=1 Tax=uncultured Caudovirales phage TaxID=2100421 RepID=A0A6J5Q128_9CAUD|nr:RecT Recombinational DNA repair protein (RecE pathway) [uncultured Caudovirales phage]
MRGHAAGGGCNYFGKDGRLMATIRETISNGVFEQFGSPLIAGRVAAFGAAVCSELKRADVDINQNIDAKVGGVIRSLYEIGLWPGPQGHISVVAFKGVPQAIVGYKGLIHLGYQSGYLARITAEVVLAGEVFSLEQRENGPKLSHAVGLKRPDPSPENVEAAYCTWTTTDGQHNAAVVQGNVIRSLRNKSKSSSQWRTENFLAMVLKTPIIRAAKWWNCSPEIATAVAVDADQMVAVEADQESNGQAAASALAEAGITTREDMQ